MNTKNKLPQFLQIKKEVLADYPRIAQGKRNQRMLGEAAKMIDEVLSLLQKVDVHEIPDPRGRKIKYPKVDHPIAALRAFVLQLAIAEEAAVNRPEARAEYAKLRDHLSKLPTPENDVIDHCKLVAFLLRILIDVQSVVESQRASSLPGENLEDHIDAAVRRSGLDGNNDSELARLRQMDGPDEENEKSQGADIRAVARRRLKICEQIDRNRQGFRDDARDTILGYLRAQPAGSPDAELARKAIESLDTLPAEAEATLIKQWTTARIATRSENGFCDVRDLIARLLQSSA